MHLLLLPLLAGLLAPELALEVPVFVDESVHLPARSLELALDEVDALFARGGIRWRWLVKPGEPDRSAAGVVTIVVSSRPEHPVVSGCTRNRHDHRLGMTELRARRITLWTEQVARAVAGAWERDPPSALDERTLPAAIGRVLAHELGHFFLQLQGHREDGLMRASFSYRALRGRNDRAFRLSTEDLEQVRKAILRFPSLGID